MTSAESGEVREMILSYFKPRAGECVHYQEVVYWGMIEWRRRYTTRRFPDISRMVRTMREEGLLDNVGCGEGEFRYSPDERE